MEKLSMFVCIRRVQETLNNNGCEKIFFLDAGAIFIEDMRTADGKVYETYREPLMSYVLLSDDIE